MNSNAIRYKTESEVQSSMNNNLIRYKAESEFYLMSERWFVDAKISILYHGEQMLLFNDIMFSFYYSGSDLNQD